MFIMEKDVGEFSAKLMQNSYSTKEIVNLILDMNCCTKNVLAASKKLVEFQSSPDAWSLSLSLLLRCSESELLKCSQTLSIILMKFPQISYLLEQEPTDQLFVYESLPLETIHMYVGFFASHTLCMLCQAGLKQVITRYFKHETVAQAYLDIRTLLLEFIWICRNTYPPILKQLSQAVLATIVFSLVECVSSQYEKHFMQEQQKPDNNQSFMHHEQQQDVETNASSLYLSQSITDQNFSSKNGVPCSVSVPSSLYTCDDKDSGVGGKLTSPEMLLRQKYSFFFSPTNLSYPLSLTHECFTQLIFYMNRSEEMYEPVLNIFEAAPIDIYDRKLAITTEDRLSVLLFFLMQSTQIFNTLCQVHDRVSGGMVLSFVKPINMKKIQQQTQQQVLSRSNLSLKIRTKIFVCFKSWLEAHSRFYRNSVGGSAVGSISSETLLTLVPLLSNELNVLSSTAAIPLMLITLEEEFQSLFSVTLAEHSEFVLAKGHRDIHLRSINGEVNLCLSLLDTSATPFTNSSSLESFDYNQQINFDPLSETLLNEVAEALISSLEFLYSSIAYAPAQGSGSHRQNNDATQSQLQQCEDRIMINDVLKTFITDNNLAIGDSLPVFNSNNLSVLLLLFESISKIDKMIRQFSLTLEDKLKHRVDLTHYINTQSNLIAGQFELYSIGGYHRVISSLIPPQPLKTFISLFDKFCQVFFPAIAFMVQFDVLCDAYKNEFSQKLLSGNPMSQKELVEYTELYTTHLNKSSILQETQSLLGLFLDLLDFPDIDIRIEVLDVWYSLMGNQFVQQHTQMEFAQKSTERQSVPKKVVLYRSSSAAVEGNSQAIFIPAFDVFIELAIQLIQIPSTLADLKKNRLGFAAWSKYRDAYAISLNEVTSVLTCCSVIKKVGPVLMNSIEEFKKAEQFGNYTMWPKVEAALFVLSSIASRAQAGEDEYIPCAINYLQFIPYDKLDVLESFLISTTAARLILWTAGFIGCQRDFFPSAFQLLRFFILSLCSWKQVVADEQTELQMDLAQFRDFTEFIFVEAMNSVVASSVAALDRHILTSDTDIAFISNGLSELLMKDNLKAEIRCLLVSSVGAVSQCLSVEKMQKFHFQLVKALHEQASCSLENCRAKQYLGGVSEETVESLKLFFTALECVQPSVPIRPPRPSPNAVPLERCSEFRHPVMNVLEEFWPLVEECIEQLHSYEILVEAACHAVIRIFCQSQAHAIRYEIFHKFLHALSKSFQRTPTVFHLGALRSIIGMFGNRTEKPIQEVISTCLLDCTQLILSRMQAVGVQEIPDLVGMTLDCINTCLISPYMTECLVSMEVFHVSLILCITLTPECNHPKVLKTTLLVMARFVAWLDKKTSREKSDANEAACNRTKELVTHLIDRLNLAEKFVHSVIKTVTCIFQGNSQWLGIVATLLQQLLNSPSYSSVTKTAIREAFANSCPPQIVSFLNVNEFCMAIESVKLITHRELCAILQRLADNAEASWQKVQFS